MTAATRVTCMNVEVIWKHQRANDSFNPPY